MVEVNDEFDVEIISTGKKGDGVAKIDGLAIIIPDTKPGDNVKIKINAVRERFAFGEVITSDDSDQEQEEESEDSYPEDSEDFGNEDSQE